jgi:hypothetical protein
MRDSLSLSKRNSAVLGLETVFLPVACRAGSHGGKRTESPFVFYAGFVFEQVAEKTRFINA